MAIAKRTKAARAYRFECVARHHLIWVGIFVEYSGHHIRLTSKFTAYKFFGMYISNHKLPHEAQTESDLTSYLSNTSHLDFQYAYNLYMN